MNVISELRSRIKKDGKAVITTDEFNRLQEEWVRRSCPIDIADHSFVQSLPELKELDEKLAAAGMIPLTVMLNTPPILGYLTHKGVDSLELFEEWLNMRHLEMMKMKAKMIIDDNQDHEMFEWVVSFAAVLSEVVANFNSSKLAGGDE